MEENRTIQEDGHFHADCCDPAESVADASSVWSFLSRNQWMTLIASGGLLILLWPVNKIVFDGAMPTPLALGLYLLAYLPVAMPVWRQAFRLLVKGSFFNEFMLMGIATIGAFYVGEFAEGVAVMLFYTIGEWMQEAAVARSRRSIKALIDSRPDHVKKLEGDDYREVKPDDVEVGDRILFKVGERISFDGSLIAENSRSVDTSSLTGESMPRSIEKNGEILAGMVPLSQDIVIEVTKPLSESTLSRMMYLVEEAATRKAPSEKLIRKLASYYTPAVFFAAVAICLVPALFVESYEFNTWLYRALVFLVISCPCALVISIPLGFYGGIGAASRRGILIKGAQFLDALNQIRAIFFDKTGTLTTGKMSVQKVEIRSGFSEKLIEMASALEYGLDHPVSAAITALHPKAYQSYKVTHRKQFQGMGVEALVDKHRMILGNALFMRQHGVEGIGDADENPGQIYIAMDGWFAGKITLSDTIKEEAPSSMAELKKMGLKELSIVSGDTRSNVADCAEKVGIQKYKAELLPEGKLEYVFDQKNNSGQKVMFVGEGFNDAPVLAAADVGLAMGQLGADASIESADIIVQTDDLDRIPTVFRIAKSTRSIIWQNIAFALSVKILVLALGAMGMATLWQAVFADVGVALIAVANAVRLQHMKFE